MRITSAAFENGGAIPSRYTCDGDRLLNPPVAWHDIPSGTISLALVMDDPDVPKEVRADGVFDHWVLYNISPETAEIPEGGTAGTAGINSRDEMDYTGPCPPPQYKPATHRYVFTLYALDTVLKLPAGASKADVLAAMQGHVIAKSELVGRYRRTL